jgi:hypothetical protein
MSATYTKLKSGEWGVRVQGDARVGQVVTVKKRDGTTKTETIEKVVWSGNGISLCAVSRSAKPAYTPRAGRRNNNSSDCDDFCQGCRRCGAYD